MSALQNAERRIAEGQVEADAYAKSVGVSFLFEPAEAVALMIGRHGIKPGTKGRIIFRAANSDGEPEYLIKWDGRAWPAVAHESQIGIVETGK
jgi:hypothetical protein